MKITASAAELTAALALAALALDDKIKVEILHAVHIEAADDVVRFTVNGGDRIIETFATVKVAEPGEAVVAAAALVGLVAGFAKNVTIEIETDKKRAQIRCGRAIYRLPVMPLEQLPPAPAIDMVMGEAELARQDLLTAIKRVKFAAEVDGTRWYLCGIYLHGTGDQLVAVTTDGHRLAKCRIPASVLQDLAAIVPIATIEPIIKLLTRSKMIERLRLRRSRTLLEIAASAFTLTTKLIEGTFPDYQRIIPKLPANSATVDRAELVAALARLEAVATSERKIAPPVGFEWSPTEPALRLSLPNQAGTAEDLIAAAIAGNAMIQSAIPLGHVLELADELSGKSVCIASDGGGEGVLITDPDNDATLIVQMPCRWSARSQAA